MFTALVTAVEDSLIQLANDRNYPGIRNCIQSRSACIPGNWHPFLPMVSSSDYCRHSGDHVYRRATEKEKFINSLRDKYYSVGFPDQPSMFGVAHGPL